MKKFLVTSALPYANGPLHFGHLAGAYLPADIFVRHQRNCGNLVRFICGSDEHGVAIMLNAEMAGKSYQEYVDHWHQDHKDLFEKLEVGFDFFGRTSAEYHAEETKDWFKTLFEAGLIVEKTEKQLFCIDDNRFLADRYVEGTCYVCDFENARGDECPNCGEWIDPIKLKNPRSKVSGSTNIEIREANNFFLRMTELESEFTEIFKEKSEAKHWRKLVTGYVNGMLKQGLEDRCITRDLDWGIKVPLPDQPENKRIYVWFDAPIGYVSNLKQYFKEAGISEDYRKDWWQSDDVELLHFIGKDNIVFHAMIFPMMGMGSGYMKFVDDVPANEFLNLAGKQFSKSSGWYVDAKEALDAFGVDSLRFYLTSIIPESGDTNFSWESFASNYAEFGNKIGNFVHRSMSFIHKNWPDGLPGSAFKIFLESDESAKITEKLQSIKGQLDRKYIVRAQNELLSLGQLANEFFQEQAPWKQRKEDPAKAEVSLAGATLYVLALASALEPFVPSVAKKMRSNFAPLLQDADFRAFYQQGFSAVEGKLIETGFKLPNAPEVLLPRLDPDLLAEWQTRLAAKSN